MQPFPWKIDFLNHASVLIHTHGMKLLTDPWYWGTCFDEGWGLRYSNDAALEQADESIHKGELALLRRWRARHLLT